MECIIFAAVVLLIILLLMIKGIFDSGKQEKNFIRRLCSDYGVLPQKLYKPERFESITHYFEKHKKEFYIDDITWNDLNMDEVFKKMNYTLSAAGEEFLYYILRTPLYREQELRRREKMIEYFRTHEQERTACQILFQKLGSTGKFSIYDYLDYLDDLGERSNRQHYRALLLIAFSIIVIFINLPIGLVALVCAFIWNIIAYFKVKNEIDPYITSFTYIFRLLTLTEKIIDQKIEILSEESKKLQEASKRFVNFQRGSFLLMSSGRMSSSSNPIDILMDYLRMIFHLDLIQFNRMLKVVRNHTQDIDIMLTIVGEIDAVIAIGAFRTGNPDHCIPEFVTETVIRADNLYHPLIESPVKNSIDARKSVLITGSNASGKSTFLKTVAINAILAQTIHTCMADSYETCLFRILSSMALRDDIQGGDSYYMVEIKSLKRILDAQEDTGIPVLCFVDEVLRGTNTVERIAASTQILKSLCVKSNLCFAATHDIELTHLLEGIYANYHFEEEIEENDIFFSYKIMNGRATTRNAIRLLHIMGYNDRIVKDAEKMAADFLEKGSWTC
ncbi:MAG: hypothetical protein ACI4ED_01140 [Suilimivivens sp.]